MQVKVNTITGFDDAFVAMYMSKRSWTPELDSEIRDLCQNVQNRLTDDYTRFDELLSKLLKIGRKHITLLRFIDISIMTQGLHRAGQDDIDAHARRFDNRIIRNSTRLATFDGNEVSDYYKDKILATDRALDVLGVKIPEKIEYEGNTYVKTVNGYVREEYKDNKDVRRGLYMLSIPSNFISKINLCEWAHVFKERNKDGGANPEVKEWAEEVMRQITERYGQITRDYVLNIEN